MTSPVIVYATVEARLNHPVAAVWARVAAVGGLEQWAAGVSACTVEGAGVGAIRTVTLNGRQVRERLEAIDHDICALRYRILPPHALPAENVHGTITLRALDDAATALVWHSDATDFQVAPEVLGARIEQFYAASIRALGRLLDPS